MGARVIGVGQRAAGDDGVGLAVIDSLRRAAVPRDVHLYEVAEPTQVISLLETPEPVIVVDAVVGADSPGQVLVLQPERFVARGLAPLSTHGVGLIEAIDLARLLTPETVTPSIRIVGVTIERPKAYIRAFSPPVERAIDQAVATILQLLLAESESR